MLSLRACFFLFEPSGREPLPLQLQGPVGDKETSYSELLDMVKDRRRINNSMLLSEQRGASDFCVAAHANMQLCAQLVHLL